VSVVPPSTSSTALRSASPMCGLPNGMEVTGRSL
jgi:hypothetical protein